MVRLDGRSRAGYVNTLTGGTAARVGSVCVYLASPLEAGCWRMLAGGGCWMHEDGHLDGKAGQVLIGVIDPVLYNGGMERGLYGGTFE